MRRRFMINSDIETPEVDMANYLTIVALEDGLTAKLSLNECYYSVDGGEWVLLGADTYTPEINIGQKLYFKGEITPSSSGSGTFTITKSCNLEGNCMSLLYGDYAKNKKFSSSHTRAFYYLFAGNNGIIEVSDDFLPSNNTVSNCYNHMFNKCSNLIKAPRLNAMEMSYRCYYFMFLECSSLFDVQEEMPATELAESCYEGMFNKCSSLTTTISLNAEIMKPSCYSTMFQHCTSLVTAPALNSVKLANLCYKWMFYGCTNLKNAPAILPATELKNECYRLMFYNTAITTAPVLPAKTLVEHCYSHMLNRCPNLNYVKALFETTPATGYTNYWLYGVNSEGTFVKSNNATWNVDGEHGVPLNWTITNENGVVQDRPISVNLNNQWRVSTGVSNPNASLYSGVYESFSNKGINSTSAIMYITINGLNSFKMYIRSYAEASCDYVMVSKLDKEIDNSTSYSSDLVMAHTRDKNNSGTSLSSYTLVEYNNIGGGEHTIIVLYKKDLSSSKNDDRGYVLIPNNQL